MMLKYLHEVALANLDVPEGADQATEHEVLRSRRKIEAQLSLAVRAILMLRSLHTDVSALRVSDGDSFTGTGDCEYGHEGVDVTLTWPNLAILIDATKDLLDEVKATDTPKVWHVFHGDCTEWFYCEAESREEAMQICADAHPGSQVHAAVPSFAKGQLLMCSYGTEPVRCPQCGSLAEFVEQLPRERWQIHACSSNHHFIAFPEDAAKEAV